MLFSHKLFIRYSAAILMLLYALLVHAQSAPTLATLHYSEQARQLSERYPGKSFNTVTQADQALKEITAVREQITVQAAAQEQNCYSRFFVTRCIDNVHENQREASALVQKIEIEANHFKRLARVEEREQMLRNKDIPTSKD